MQDDFNTPLALSQVFEAVREINVSGDPALVGFIQHVGNVSSTCSIKIRRISPCAFQMPSSWTNLGLLSALKPGLGRSGIEIFEQADAIRTELAEAGVEIEDSREEHAGRLK